MQQFQCKICNKEFESYDSLRRHSGNVHKIKSEQFNVDFYHNGIHPTCKCGCGEETNFNGRGFKDYKRGHIARIHNNWGHNQKAIDNSSNTRREQFKSGERIQWNKGKSWDETFSKEVQEKLLNDLRDPVRCKKISKSHTGKKHSEEHNKNNAASVKKAWENPELREKQRFNRIEYFTKHRKIAKQN